MQGILVTARRSKSEHGMLFKEMLIDNWLHVEYPAAKPNEGRDICLHELTGIGLPQPIRGVRDSDRADSKQDKIPRSHAVLFVSGSPASMPLFLRLRTGTPWTAHDAHSSTFPETFLLGAGTGRRKGKKPKGARKPSTALRREGLRRLWSSRPDSRGLEVMGRS